ncbi:hypothetical protein HYT84_01155 [Candidatus Micrarchaeota archaeon]|nr:hypothetical protein [Candidatus Micrarchaeota archaeon]
MENTKINLIGCLILVFLLFSGCTAQQKQSVGNFQEKTIPPLILKHVNQIENVTEQNGSKYIAPLVFDPEIKKQAKLDKEEVDLASKNLKERLEEAYDRLHTFGSGAAARKDFTDLKLVYTDNAKDAGFPQMILPFKYYYSEEADKTFNICAIDLTVFICDGKLDKLISKQDIENGKCTVTSVYKADSRLGY